MQQQLIHLLKCALVENDIALSQTQSNKILRYLELMMQWNQVYNLTALTTPEDMIYRHIIDSLKMLPYLSKTNYLDVGTGAGLPGIPLAIAQLDDIQTKWTLIDKNGKKTRFLNVVIAELALNEKVKVIHSACEDFKPDQCFDTILARAFSSLANFAALSARLLCPGGLLLAMKGKFPREELNALDENKFIVQTMKIDIVGVNMERHVVTMKLRSEDS